MPKMVFLGSYVHKPIYIWNQLSSRECFKSVHKATLFPVFLSGQTKAEKSTLPKGRLGAIDLILGMCTQLDYVS